MKMQKKAHLNSNRQIVTTADGSTSIYLKDARVQYHSKHGAILEAKHVFIKSGLHYLLNQNTNPISIFEMGFGTGLNCMLTQLEALKQKLNIDYTAIEAYPIIAEEAAKLNFHEQFNYPFEDFLNLHKLDVGISHTLSPFFKLQKITGLLQDFSANNMYNLVYFDAFGATAQPELWTKPITDQLFKMLKPNGVVVTYSVKGSFRRNLLESGFSVQKIQGPPGKREMLRAIK